MLRRTRHLAALFGTLQVLAFADSGINQVTDVRFWSFPGVTRVILQTTGPSEYKADRAINPERLFFDLENARPFIDHKRIYTHSVSDGLVDRIRIAETAPGTTRIVFDLKSAAKYTVERLDTPDRLVIELRPVTPPAVTSTAPNVTSAASLRQTQPSQTELTQARPKQTEPSRPEPGRPEPGYAKSGKNQRRFELPVAKDASLVKRPQILVPAPPQLQFPAPELSLAILNQALSAPNASAPAPVITSSIKVLPPVSRPALTQTTALASENAERSLTRALGLKVNRIVIDAGHGGHDEGTSGQHGILEKDVVLDVALRLSKLVQEKMGVEVVLTRSEDNFVPLHERTEIANTRKADLFLSIHANSSPAREVAGTETFYLNFSTSPAAIDLAARENAGSEKTVGELKDLIQSITLNDKIEESQTLANKIEQTLQAQVSKANPAAHDRGIKRAPFVVLIGARMPSILAEIGFLSNPKDEANLARPEYRQKIAEALFKGLNDYSRSLSHLEEAKTETKVARVERVSGRTSGVQH